MLWSAHLNYLFLPSKWFSFVLYIHLQPYDMVWSSQKVFFPFAFYNSPRDYQISLWLCNLLPNPNKLLFKLLLMFLRTLKIKTKNPATLSKFVWKYLKIFLQDIILAFLQIWLSSFITNTSAIFHSSMRSINVLTNTMGISTYSKLVGILHLIP